jgi:hypothetical protein
MLIVSDVLAVAALEQLTSPEVCPWWSLFGRCKGSLTDECKRCPTQRLATQKQVDDVAARCDVRSKRRIAGVPTDTTGKPMPNPAPGTGNSAAPSPAKKAKLDAG